MFFFFVFFYFSIVPPTLQNQDKGGGESLDCSNLLSLAWGCVVVVVVVLHN